MKAVEAAFGEEQKEEDLDRHQKAMPRDRFLVAYDGAIPVGTTASLPFELTVPGGAVAAVGCPVSRVAASSSGTCTDLQTPNIGAVAPGRSSMRCSSSTASRSATPSIASSSTGKRGSRRAR